VATPAEEKQQYIERRLARGMSAEEARTKADELEQQGVFGVVGRAEIPTAPRIAAPQFMPPSAPEPVEVAPLPKAPTLETPGPPGPPDTKVEEFLDKLKAAYERQIERPEERPQPGITAPRSIPEVVIFHSRELGLQPNEFKAAVKARGVDIDYMIKEVGRRGRDPTEVIEEAKKRGVSEFAGPKARELATQREMVRKKAVERYEERGEDIPAWLREPQNKGYVWSEERAWFQSDPAEAKEVVKPGEGIAGRTAFEIWEEAVEGDSDLAHLVDLNKNKLVSGYEFVEDYTEALINRDLEWDTLSGKERERRRNAYRQQSVYKMALAKTVGAWTGATFLPYASLNEKEVSLAQAMMPTVEVVGINADNKAVLRQQSGLSYAFEMFDVPQAIAVGIASDLYHGELDSYSAVKGIAERKDFFTASIEATEGMGTAARIAAGLAGFGAAVLFPDVLLGAAGAAKLAARPIHASRARRIGAITADAAIGRATGGVAGHGEAAAAESALRSNHGRIADNLDIKDAQVAGNLANANPDIFSVRLSNQLPGDLRDSKLNLHASVRKDLLRPRVKGEKTSQTIAGDYAELYGTQRHLDRIAQERRAIEAGDYIDMPLIQGDLVKPKQSAIVAAGRAAGDDGALEVRQLIEAAFAPESLLELIKNPGAWKAKWVEGEGAEMYKLSTLPSIKAELAAAEAAGAVDEVARLKEINKARAVVHKSLAAAPKLIKGQAGKTAEWLKALDRTEEAVKMNNESRAAASLLLREELYGLAKIEPPPLQIRASIKEAMKVPDLSAEARLFTKALLKATQGISRERAQALSALMDARARAWAIENSAAPADWPGWRTQIAGMEEFAERHIRRGDALDYDHEAVARASLPEGIELRKAEGKWEAVDEADKVLGAAADPVDAAAAAIDKLVAAGKITKSDFDKSATRVGPLLLGQPLSVAEDAIRRLGVEYAMAHTEDGVHVIRATSNAPNYVSFTTAETQRMMKAPGLGFTHNHPNGSALSGADVIYGTRLDARQMRATRPDGGVWILDVPDGFGELSDAVLLEKYGSWGNIPAAVRQRSREYKDAVKAAVDGSARRASERIHELSAQGEKYVGKDLDYKWAELYSEEFQQRVPAVLEGYGIEHTFRLEPGDADLRPRPGVERTFGARARAAAERVGPERLLLQADEVDAAAAGATSADEIAEAREIYEKILSEDRSPLESRFFKNWFGESKVVDEAGEPLVVYHGSDTPNLEEFRHEKAGGLFWFTPRRGTAENYSLSRLGVDTRTEAGWEEAVELGVLDDVAKNFVTEGYLSLKNPLDLRDTSAYRIIADIDPEFGAAHMTKEGRRLVDRIIKAAKDIDAGIGSKMYFWRLTKDESWLNAWANTVVPQLEMRGYDGLIMVDAADTGLAYAAFKPTQIKSKLNVGTFDPDDPRILFQKTAAGTEAAVKGEDPIFYSELEKVVEGLNDVYQAQPASVSVSKALAKKRRKARRRGEAVTEVAEPIPILYTKKSKAVQRGEAKVGDPVIDPVTGEPRLTYRHEGVKIPARSLKDVVLEAVRVGAKEEEIKWTNLEEFLDDLMAQGQHSVTRDELLGHLKNNRVVVEETSMGVLPPALKAAKAKADEAYEPVQDGIRKWARKMTEDHQMPFDGTEVHRVKTDPEYIWRDVYERLREVNNESKRWTSTGWSTVPLSRRLPPRRVPQAIQEEFAEIGKVIEGWQREGIASTLAGSWRTPQEMLDRLPRMAQELADDILSPDVAAEYERSKSFLEARGRHLDPDAFEVRVPDEHTVLDYETPTTVGGLIPPGTKAVSATDHVVIVPDEYLEAAKRAAAILDEYSHAIKLHAELRDLASVPGMFRTTKALADSPEFVKWKKVEAAAGDLEDSLNLKAPMFKNWTLGDGGENYREVLVTFKSKAPEILADPDVDKLKNYRRGFEGSAAHDVYKALRDKVYTRYGVPADVDSDDWFEGLRAQTFTEAQGSHWDTPNVLVHIRATDRVAEDGRKILYVEEIQSDLHQKGRQRGYRSDAEKKLVPFEAALVRLEQETKLLRDWHKAHPHTDSVRLGQRLQHDDDLFKDRLALDDVVGDARQAKIDALPPRMRKAWDDYTEWEKARYAFYEEGNKRVSEHGRFINRTPVQDAQADVVNAGDQVGLRLTATMEGTGADIVPGFNYSNRSTLLWVEELRRYARANQGRNAIPDAPFKDTKAWAGLAVKRIMQIAVDEGYAGIAFPTGAIASKVVSMPLDAAQEFYDTILPSVVKEHTRAPLREAWFDDGVSANGAEVPFVDLKPQVAERVGGPQVLFQKQAVEALTAEAEAEGIDKLRRSIQNLPEDAKEAHDAFQKQFGTLFGTYRSATGYGAESLYTSGDWLAHTNAESLQKTLANVAAGSASPEQYRLLKYLYDNPNELAKVTEHTDSRSTYMLFWDIRWLTKAKTEAIIDGYAAAQRYGIRGVTVDDILSGRFMDTLEKAGGSPVSAGAARRWDSIRRELKKSQKTLDDAGVDFTYKYEAPSRVMIVNTLIGRYGDSLFRAATEGTPPPPPPNLEIFLTPARKQDLPRKGAGYDTFGAGAEEDYARFIAEGDRSITLERLFEGVEAVPPRPAMGVTEPADVGKFVESPAGTPKKALKWYERAAARKRGRGQILRQTLRTRDKLGKAWKTDSGIATIPDHEYGIVKEFVAMVGTKRLENIAFAIEPKIRTGMMLNEPLGLYFFGRDIVGISHSAIASGRFVDTTIHELWHGLSQFLPDSTVKDLYKQFARERGQFMRTNPDAFDRAGKLIDINMAKNQSTYRFSSFDEWVVEKMKDLSIQDASRRLFAKGKGVDPTDLPYAKPWQQALRALADLVRSHYNQIKAIFGRDVARQTYNDFMRSKYTDQVRSSPLADVIKITPEDEAAAAARWSEYLDALDAEEGVLAAAVRMSDETEQFLGAMVTGPAETITPQEFRALASEAVGARAPETPAATAAKADSRVLHQFDEDVAKAAIEFVEDGDAIIYAFEKADVSSIVHEIGHLFRRDLDNADMGIVTSWLKTQHGLEVGHDFGKFTATSDDIIVQAEELFARAFERYIAEGQAPVPRLAQVFERLKEWMVEIYKVIAGSEIDVKMTVEVKSVFDRLLRDMPTQEAGLPRVNKFIRDQILGVKREKTVSAFAFLVDEARRIGMPKVTIEDLQRQFDDTGKVVLPAPVEGQTEWSRAALGRLQADLENRQLAAEAMQEPGLAIRSAADSVKEETASERIDNWVHKQKGVRGAIGQFAKAIVLGGDADGALRELPPAIRRAINAGGRKVEEAIGNAVTILGELDRDKMLKFLSGEIVEFKQGRQAYASGFNAVTEVAVSLSRTLNTPAMQKQHSALRALAAYVEEARKSGTSMGEALSKLPDKAVATGPLKELEFPKAMLDDAVQKLIYDASGEDNIIVGIREGLQVAPKAGADALGRRVSPPAQVYETVEVLTYFAGLTMRDGKLYEGSAYNLADVVLGDVERVWGKPQSNRISLLIAGHGHAHAARRMWVQMGLAVDQEVQQAFLKWVNGEQVPLEMLPKVQAVVQRYGMNPRFLEQKILDTPYYLPEQARKRLGDALARAGDIRTKIQLHTSEQEMHGIFGWTLRYIKKVMTRGGFVTRPRYFLMNTFDHFNQMSMIVGFRPAAASTARMVAQNFLTIPGVAQFIRALEEVGVANPQAVERVRRSLQRHGDKASQLLSGSKYRIDVNAILEGHEGVIRVGDRVYSYRRLREMAVEEGIFASFDTTQLKKAVDSATPAAFKKQDPRRVGAGLLKLTEDVAETWAERERLGAMITLVEMGYPPRKAARFTIKALYDYAGSMSKMDRAWWVSLIMPFWAFQKNANRQILDAMLSPRVAYRMGVIRRAEELGPEAVTQILYDFVAEPYGVDVDALPDEAQDNYYVLRKLVEDHYEGPHKVPRDARLALRMLFAERQMGIYAGKYVELDHLLQKADRLTHLKTGAAAIPFPDPSAKGGWVRERPSAAVTLPRTEAVQAFMNYINATQTDYAWTEVMLPESTIHAGMRHLAGYAAFLITMSELGVEAGHNLMADEFDPLANPAWAGTVDPVASLHTIVQPERSPITAQVLDVWLKSPESRRAVRVTPYIADLLDYLGWDVAKYEGVEDPIWAQIEEKRGVDPAEAGVVPTRYYVSPGIMSFALENSPLGELNKLLKQWEISPLERTHWSGEILRWARGLSGLQTTEVHRPKAVRGEEPRFEYMGKRPPMR